MSNPARFQQWQYPPTGYHKTPEIADHEQVVVSWRIKATGQMGHGQSVTRKEAIKFLSEMNISHTGAMSYWVIPAKQFNALDPCGYGYPPAREQLVEKLRQHASP
jgi:hypothetical protein